MRLVANSLAFDTHHGKPVVSLRCGKEYKMGEVKSLPGATWSQSWNWRNVANARVGYQALNNNFRFCRQSESVTRNKAEINGILTKHNRCAPY
jgi:hypothetical protein